MASIKHNDVNRNRRTGKHGIRNYLCLLAGLFFLGRFIYPAAVHAQYYPGDAAKQFQQRFSIGGKINGALVIVGLPSDEKNVEKLAGTVIAEAERTYQLLNADNPGSEVARLSSRAAQGPVKISWQVLDALRSAKKVASWTKGAFDIVMGNGNHNDLSLNDKASTAELKKTGMRLNLDPMMEGYLADYIIKMVYAAKMQNAMVKVGNVFRGIGNSPYGPWKIQVQEDSAAYARHALNLTVSNTGIATISATQFRAAPLIDFRSKKAIAPRLKGATIVMNEAALAQGIAYAVFVFGPNEGLNFLNKLGKARGLIVDSQGRFLKTAGM